MRRVEVNKVKIREGGRGEVRLVRKENEDSVTEREQG